MNEHTIEQNIQEKVETQPPMNFANLHLIIFSMIFQYLKWISSLRWYIIVLIVFVFLFLIFQFEQSIESRRRKKESDKEGMRVKGILRDVDVDADNLEYTNTTRGSKSSNLKKRVSFKEEDEYQEYSDFGGQKNKKSPTIKETLANIYKLWILPGIYVLSRKSGL